MSTPTDQELAARAVARGLMPAERLEACHAERRRLLKDGLDVGLRELLLERGLLDAAQWAALAQDAPDHPAPGGPAAPAPGPPPPASSAPVSASVSGRRAPSTRMATRRDDSRAADAGEASGERELLGGYRIVREIGRGAMGVVYEAVQERLGRRVALKVLPMTQALSDVARERFLREAQATASLRHPGIVPIYDTGEERGVHFFAMELLEGRSLKRVLEEDGPLAPEEAARVARDVALALHEAHEHGVVHRDVKPDNVIRRPDGSVVVTDFGLALRERDATLTRDGTIVGTPLYMSPEQARGDGAPVDRRADVYGLGVTLYELLAGKVPFEDAEDTAELLVAVAQDDPPPLAQVARDAPAPLRAIVEVAIEKDPARRYPTARAMAEDLARYLAGEPILARPPSRLTRAWRVVRRRARRVGAMALLVVVVVALALALRLLATRWRADALVLEAVGQARAGQPEAAAATLARALEVWPGLAEARFRLGELDEAAGRLDAARARYDEALAGDPTHAEALLARARLLRRAGQLEAALADLGRAAAAARPGDPRPALAEGLALVGLGRAAEARGRLREGLETARLSRTARDALYAEAVHRLGECELLLGEVGAAITELEEAVRLLPNEVAPQVLLAQALTAAGNDPAAVEALSAALRRDPGHARALELRGRAHRRLGAHPEAFRDLSAAADQPSALLARGLLRFETVDFLPPGRDVAFDDKGARRDLEAAAQEPRLAPRDRAAALVALGWLELAGEGYKTRALERFDQALALAPDALGASLARGHLLAGWPAHAEEARAELERALALPGGRYAALVGLARVALAAGDVARARAHLDEAVALEPGRTTAWGWRYRVRLAQGDAGAREDRERAIAAAPEDAARPFLPFDARRDPLALAEQASRLGFAAFVDAVREAGDSAPWEHDLARADAYLGRALAFDPGALQASARRASVLYLRADFPGAAAAYARARENDPALFEAEVLRAVLERDLLGDAGPAAAEATLTAALAALDAGAAAPAGAEGAAVRAAALYERARARAEQGRLDAALEDADAARALAPRRHAPAALRARLAARLGRPEAALDARRAAGLLVHGERDRLRGRLYTKAGRRLEDRDAFGAAVHFLTRAIEADPQNALAWRLRGSARFQGDAGELPAAFVDTFMAAELDAAFAARFVEVEARLQRFRPLLATIEGRVDDLLVQLPDLPASPFFKGYVGFLQGRDAEAIGWFDRAFVASEERSSMALAYRGAARLRAGEREAARADLERAAALRPTPVVHFWLACLRAAEGDLTGAIGLLEAATAGGTNLGEQIRGAPELAPVRDDPRVRRLVGR